MNTLKQLHQTETISSVEDQTKKKQNDDAPLIVKEDAIEMDDTSEKDSPTPTPSSPPPPRTLSTVSPPLRKFSVALLISICNSHILTCQFLSNLITFQFVAWSASIMGTSTLPGTGPNLVNLFFHTKTAHQNTQRKFFVDLQIAAANFISSFTRSHFPSVVCTCFSSSYCTATHNLVFFLFLLHPTS